MRNSIKYACGIVALSMLLGSAAEVASADEAIVLNGTFFYLDKVKNTTQLIGVYEVWRDASTETGYAGRIRGSLEGTDFTALLHFKTGRDASGYGHITFEIYNPQNVAYLGGEILVEPRQGTAPANITYAYMRIAWARNVQTGETVGLGGDWGACAFVLPH